MIFTAFYSNDRPVLQPGWHPLTFECSKVDPLSDFHLTAATYYTPLNLIRLLIYHYYMLAESSLRVDREHKATIR
jgi:hypothetical protein